METAKGKAHIKKASYVFTDNFLLASNTWTINHNLNVTGIIVQFFDNDDNEMLPNTFSVTSENQCVALWSTDVSGYALLDIIVKDWTLDGIISTIRVWKVGTGGSLGYKVIDNNDLETPVLSGATLLRDPYEDDNYYYIDFEVPSTENDIEITEMGLFDEGNIMFYTNCSCLYKPSNMALTVNYKISKELN